METTSVELTVWCIALVSSLVALFFAHRFYKWMMQQYEGNEDMVRIAGYVRAGADALQAINTTMVAFAHMLRAQRHRINSAPTHPRNS